jgi:polysaccharide pyruvyl transferase WcaK-like protein
VHVLEGTYEPDQIKWIIGLCSFFLGSRMHSCIAALSQCIPTCGLAYSKKFIGVFNSLGMEDTVIDLRVSSKKEILHKIIHMYKNSDVQKKYLEETMNKTRNLVESGFRKLLLHDRIGT